MKKNKAMNFSLNCPPFNAGIACRAFAAFALGGLLLMAPSVAFADGMEQNVLQQQGTVKVTGVIKDIAGEPVIGANVVVKGTTNGIISDIDGNFTLSVRSGDVLVISYLGYQTQEITVGRKTNFNIILKDDAKSLDEVVVVGFGTQKKVNLTGAVSMVDAKVMEDRPVINAVQALQGAVPGLQITSNSGALDKNASIRIRGANTLGSASADPLILIDGMEGDINSINPQDIENVSVLKDAAANAIYGARGANGVILITTKKGDSKEAVITVDAKWGSNRRAVPTYDVMTDPGMYYETMYRALYNSKAYNGSSMTEAYAFADAALLDDKNGGVGYLVYTVPEGEKLIGTNFKLNPNATLGYSDGKYYYRPDDWYDEAFGNYGRLIFPVDMRISNDLTLENISSILPWYSEINTDKTVEIVNYLRNEAESGRQIFYDIYSDSEKADDPEKQNTGIFFFKGNDNAKSAVVNAGGGFVYVAGIHDSFPHALELSKKGYNAFALIYRPGAQTACEDLARAIAFLYEHSAELNIDMTDYSLWGGSAGARMAAWLGSYGTSTFGEKTYPNPASVIMQYTGLSQVQGNEPPTYACVGTSDGIASYRSMERYINQIKRNGTNAEIEVFNGLSHGFGLGQGTVAEGWINNAVSFWESNMKGIIK